MERIQRVKQIVILMALVLSILFLSSCFLFPEEENVKWEISNYSQYIYKVGDRISATNDNHTIVCELDNLGYSPSDGNHHVFCKFKSGIDINLDLALVSPTKFKSGSKFLVGWQNSRFSKYPHNFTCSGNSYGWLIDDKLAFCNTTVVANGTDSMQTIDVTSENYFDIPTKTIHWNSTQYTQYYETKDLTSQFNYVDKNTTFGNNIYYANFNMVKDIEYDVEFVINVGLNSTPVKYSLVFGDISESKIYFVLDPTITGSRTWTTTEDFDNNTVIYDLNTADDELKLNTRSKVSIPAIAHWKLEDMTDEIGSNDWTDTSTISTSGIIDDGREMDGSASNLKLTGLKNLAIRGSTNPFSINFWVNPNSTTGTTIWYDEHNSGPGGVIFRSDDGIVNYWYQDAAVAGTETINIGSWNMVTMTYNGSRFHTYVNNVRDITNQSTTFATQSTNDITFGIYSHTAAGDYFGKADEISIYYGELTEDDVDTLWNSGNGLAYPDGDRYLAGYRFEGDVSDIKDSYDGTNQGVSFVAGGVEGLKGQFTSADTDYYTIAYASELNPTTYTCVSFWLALDSITDADTILMSQDIFDGFQGYDVQVRTTAVGQCSSGTCLCFTVAGVERLCTDDALEVGSSLTHWAINMNQTHVVWWANGSIYETKAFAASRTISTDTDDYTVGALSNNGKSNYFNGQLDDFRIWKDYCTEDDIAAAYNLVSYETVGNFSDRQGWSPDTSKQFINISLELTGTATDTNKFRYNCTNNASLDTSLWTEFTTSGTNLITLDGCGDNEDIFFQIELSDSSGSATPIITSFTLNEASGAGGDSCDTNTWDCTENCDVAGLDAGGNPIYITGGSAGDTITITDDVTGCATSGDRIIRKGICVIRREGNVQVC